MNHLNQFYLTLPSDSSMEVFPNNALCCYTAKLPQAIHLDQEQNWEVALVEIIHPTQINNVLENQNWFDVKVNNQELHTELAKSKTQDSLQVKKVDDQWTYRLKVEAGYYLSGEHLVTAIAEAFDEIFDDALKKFNSEIQKSVTIKYHKTARRLWMKLPSHHLLTITFCPELYDMLGGDPTKMKDKKLQNQLPSVSNTLDVVRTFRFPVELNQGVNLMFVYSDVVDYNVVGHTSAPLLRVIPFKMDSVTTDNQEGGHIYHVHREFVHPHYLPVSKTYFDSVNISIKGDLGQSIPFTKGKVTTKLHFRKRLSNDL